MPQLRLTDRLDVLARLEPAPFPLLSLYLNTESDGRGRPSYNLFLRKELRQRLKMYPERSADKESLERDVDRIEGYLAGELRPSTRGLAVFARSGTDFFEALQLDVPFDRNRLVVANRPHLYPLARLDDEHPRYAALVVDTHVARIFVFCTGKTVRSEELQSPKTKHSKAGGWSQARFQRHVENVHLRHAKEVVERLDAIVAADAIDRVVLAGDEVIVPLLKAQLPERLAHKLVDVLRLDIRSPEHEVLAATLEALQRKDEQTDEAVVQNLIGEYRRESNKRLAIIGARQVLAALRLGQVDTLVIAAAPEQVTGADEAANDLVTMAEQTSASVRFIENPALLAEVGGVGAWLRYPLELIDPMQDQNRGAMSKNINVNPDHYKVAGRERQGEDVVHEIEKREMTRLRRDENRVLSRQQPETTAQPPDQPEPDSQPAERTGISNRLSGEAEARELQAHPPIDTNSPPPEDVAGRVGEEPLEDLRDRQTSHKAGSRSIAQKEAGSRYPDRSMPASRKVAGAFGREPRPADVGSWPEESSTMRPRHR